MDFEKQLDLLGEWDVALINILYLRNWTTLDKSYKYFLLRQPIEGFISEFAPENEKYQNDLYDHISKQTQFRGWVIDRAPLILRGNCNISKI